MNGFMHRLAWLVIGCVGYAGLASAAVSAEKIQGLYEGTCGDQKVEARLVALKDNAFKLLVRPCGDSKAAKFELDGKVEGDAVQLAGKDAKASAADDGVKGEAGQAKLELKRVVRESATMGAKPPEGAVVILDGKDFSELVVKAGKDGKVPEWKIVEPGAIQVPKGGMSSKRPFAGSFKYHVEFKCPLMPAGTGQGRGNSGCFMPNGDEIQVLDSFGMDTYTGGGCGGLYKYKDPDTFDRFSLASAPPLQWQTYDVEYRVTVKDGKPTGKPRITVLHNGIKIHDNVELQKDARAGSFNWQDHGNPVQYRNIWVLEVKEVALFSAKDAAYKTPDGLAEAAAACGGLVHNAHPFLNQDSRDQWEYQRRHDAVIANTEMLPDQMRYQGRTCKIGGKKAVHDLLRAGGRLGFVSGSDTHECKPEARTAVLANELTREAIFDALRHHRNYAVSHKPVRLDFRINGQTMGQEVDSAAPPSLSISVIGTAPLAEVSVIRDGAVLASRKTRTQEAHWELTDKTFRQSGYYYLRVTQSDRDEHGNNSLAWSSPIWVKRKTSNG